jgi:hypothetical protein
MSVAFDPETGDEFDSFPGRLAEVVMRLRRDGNNLPFHLGAYGHMFLPRSWVLVTARDGSARPRC